MKSELRRRIEQLEQQFPTATAKGCGHDGHTSDAAFAKATAFVEAHGGRQGDETWATAMARIMGITTAALMAGLKDRAEGVVA